MNESDIERILAVIIANTRTKSRSISLVDLAKQLHVAREHFGSLQALGDRVGLSGKMLGQFLMVDRLIDPVVALVDSRKIDSVDAVAHISQLSDLDQEEASRRVIEDRWSTADIRAFVEARKHDSESDSTSLAEKVTQARSEKQFAFEFVVRGTLDEKGILKRLSRIVPENHVIAVVIRGTRGELVVDEFGFEAMQAESKRERIPLRSILPQIIYR